MHAMRDRERKRLHRGKKGRHGRPINKTVFSLLGAGEGDANEPVVVGKYTQTRQRWLKGKTKGKRMLRKVVSTLFPQDLSVLDVVEGHLWKPSGKKSPMMRATRN